MSTLFGLLIINLVYFIYHFGFKPDLKFKSVLNTLKLLQQAQKENKRVGIFGWLDECDYERESKVYGLKYTKLTKDGNRITEITFRTE